jgi:FdhD protein
MTVPPATTIPARGVSERRAVSISGAPADAMTGSWGIAVEAPVEIALNGVSWTVMLATPADLDDLAIGLALTERVLRDARTVERVERSEYLSDISVNLVVPEAQLDRAALRARSLVGGSACGLCGLESLAQLHARSGRALPGDDAQTLGTPPAVSDEAVMSAFAALPMHQPINRETHSVHAAAWCDLHGAIALVREDVGRHNALDKLIGALARQDRLTEPGFIVMSSRASYELVYKATAASTALLATLSAPTTMALEWAAALGLPLACRAGGGAQAGVVHFPVAGAHAG